MTCSLTQPLAVVTDLQDELNLINLNVVSTVHLAKRVVKDIVERGQGKIQGNISRILPDTVNAEQHRQLTEPGSANK